MKDTACAVRCVWISCCWVVCLSAEWCLSHLSPTTNQQYLTRGCARVCLCVHVCLTIWQSHHTRTPMSEELELKYANQSISQLYVLHMKSPRKKNMANSPGWAVASVYTGLFSCVTVPVSLKHSSASLVFTFRCFWEQAVASSLSAPLLSTLLLPLTASKCDIILRAECLLPFSRVFSESQSSVKR